MCNIMEFSISNCICFVIGLSTFRFSVSESGSCVAWIKGRACYEACETQNLDRG